MPVAGGNKNSEGRLARTRARARARAHQRDPLSRVSRLASRRPYLTAHPILLIIRAATYAGKSLRDGPRAESFIGEISLPIRLIETAKANSVIPRQARPRVHVYI